MKRFSFELLVLIFSFANFFGRNLFGSFLRRPSAVHRRPHDAHTEQTREYEGNRPVLRRLTKGVSFWWIVERNATKCSHGNPLLKHTKPPAGALSSATNDAPIACFFMFSFHSTMPPSKATKHRQQHHRLQPRPKGVPRLTLFYFILFFSWCERRMQVDVHKHVVFASVVSLLLFEQFGLPGDVLDYWYCQWNGRTE